MSRTPIVTSAFSGLLRCALIVALIMGTAAQAATVNLTANDSIGTSSFNSAGNWSNAAAPSAGNNYTNLDVGGLGHLLRTPASNADFTFAGDSLTIASNNPTDLNQSLIFKGTGGSAATPNVITVNNMILNSGYIRQGNGSADFFALAGNLTINGGGFNVQGPTYINSLISGSADTFLDTPGNTDAARTLHFTNGGNTWTGSLNLNAGSPNFSKFELDSTGVLNFVIGASGVNNRVFGPGTAIYDGAFNFNLSGASTNIGDLWAVAAATGGQTFTGTFAVNGFSNLGGGLWQTSANGSSYQFDQATGNLTVVPEPTSLMLLTLGGLGLLAIRRR